MRHKGNSFFSLHPIVSNPPACSADLEGVYYGAGKIALAFYVSLLFLMAQRINMSTNGNEDW